MGVPISFKHGLRMFPRNSPDVAKGQYCAIGTIDYSVVDGKDAQPGTLIYLKAACYQIEPVDVRNYATECASFPHESTANQFFSESQFESYRMLGSFMVDTITNSVANLPDLEGLKREIEKYAGIPMSVMESGDACPT